MSKEQLLMRIITLHILLVVALDRGIFLKQLPKEKYLSPKKSPLISHNDLKKDGTQ